MFSNSIFINIIMFLVAQICRFFVIEEQNQKIESV